MIIAGQNGAVPEARSGFGISRQTSAAMRVRSPYQGAIASARGRAVHESNTNIRMGSWTAIACAAPPGCSLARRAEFARLWSLRVQWTAALRHSRTWPAIREWLVHQMQLPLCQEPETPRAPLRPPGFCFPPTLKYRIPYWQSPWSTI